MPSAKSEMDSNCLTPHVISTAPFFIGLDFETNLTAAKATPPSFGTYHPANGLAIRRPGFWGLALAVRRWPAAKKPPKYPLTDSCNAAKRSSRDVNCLASPRPFGGWPASRLSYATFLGDTAPQSARR